MIDPNIEFFPLKWLTPQIVAPGKVNAVMSGPQPLDGAPQTVQSGAGRWKIAYRNMRMRASGILVARAFLSRISVPVTPAYVSPADWLRSPRILAGLPSNASAVTFSDASVYSDGTRMSDTTPDFQLTNAVAAMASTITVTPLTSGLMLQGGQIIGIDERMHEIVSAVADDAGGTSNQILTIWPPTRAAYAAGLTIESENPFCRMVLDPKSAALAPEIAFGRYAYFDLTFVEDDWN